MTRQDLFNQVATAANEQGINWQMPVLSAETAALGQELAETIVAGCIPPLYHYRSKFEPYELNEALYEIAIRFELDPGILQRWLPFPT